MRVKFHQRINRLNQSHHSTGNNGVDQSVDHYIYRVLEKVDQATTTRGITLSSSSHSSARTKLLRFRSPPTHSASCYSCNHSAPALQQFYPRLTKIGASTRGSITRSTRSTICS